MTPWRKSSHPARAWAGLGRDQTARNFLTRINKANGQIFLSLSNELHVKQWMLKPYYHNYQKYCEIKSLLVWPRSATRRVYAQDLRLWGGQ